MLNSTIATLCSSRMLANVVRVYAVHAEANGCGAAPGRDDRERGRREVCQTDHACAHERSSVRLHGIPADASDVRDARSDAAMPAASLRACFELSGTGAQTASICVTDEIISPPVRNGASLQQIQAAPEHAFHAGPNALCAGEREEVAANRVQCPRAWGTDWALSTTSGSPPERGTRSAMAARGFSIPRTFDTCAAATILAPASFWHPAPRSVITLLFVGVCRLTGWPLLRHACCHGTRFEWCSMMVTHTSVARLEHRGCESLCDQVERFAGVSAKHQLARIVRADEARDARTSLVDGPWRPLKAGRGRAGHSRSWSRRMRVGRPEPQQAAAPWRRAVQKARLGFASSSGKSLRYGLAAMSTLMRLPPRKRCRAQWLGGLRRRALGRPWR